MSEVKEWITVHPNGKENKGQPIPIMEGQTKGDAIKSFVDKKQSEKSHRQNTSYGDLNVRYKSKYFEKAFNKLDIAYLPIQKLSTKLTEKEIINRVSGGDKTKGSCVSLAFAYVGNKSGLDILDFRGGESLNFFATNLTIQEIARLEGVKSFIVSNNNDYKAVSELIKNIKNDNEYILAIGKHASIVKKVNNSYYYLELQEADKNKNFFKKLDNEILKKRFGCVKSNTLFGMKVYPKSILIDCETLGKNKDFQSMLGYINTKKEKQKKGKEGYVK